MRFLTRLLSRWRRPPPVISIPEEELPPVELPPPRPVFPPPWPLLPYREVSEPYTSIGGRQTDDKVLDVRVNLASGEIVIEFMRSKNNVSGPRVVVFRETYGARRRGLRLLSRIFGTYFPSNPKGQRAIFPDLAASFRTQTQEGQEPLPSLSWSELINPPGRKPYPGEELSVGNIECDGPDALPGEVAP